jgi:arsenical-resistance protein 2
MASSQRETPWYASYPAARCQSPRSISRAELLQLFKDGKEAGKDFALVDLRRTDFEVWVKKHVPVVWSPTLPCRKQADPNNIRVGQSVGLSTFRPKVFIQHLQLFTRCSNLLACLRSSGTAVCSSFGLTFSCLSCPGSSRGRGNRAAGWFADYLEDRGNTTMQSLVLAEGIRGWAGAGAQYTELMVEYDGKVWETS